MGQMGICPIFVERGRHGPHRWLSVPITVTVKRRPKINPANLLNDLKNEVLRHVPRVSDFYGQSVETWATKPEFPGKITDTGNKYSVNIYARGEVRAIYAQIDAGFQRQIAVTPDWQSKTQPGILRAREGRGHLLRGPNGKPVLLQTPEPVIPRRFTPMIADLIRQDFHSGMAAVFKRHIGDTNG